MTEKNDLTPLNDDQQLQIEIKEGRITANEVAEIWRQTEDLSPQTNINARREIIALRNLAKGKGPIEALAAQFPVFCNMMLRATNETQAALMRDESKFAHLVAGAEMVAKSMQEIGSLVDVLKDARSILGDMDHLSDQMDEIREMLQPKKRWWHFWWQAWKYIPNWRKHEPEGDELPDEQDHAWAKETIQRNMMTDKCYHCGINVPEPGSYTCSTCLEKYERSKDAPGCGPGNVNLPEEGIPADDPAEKARKRTIGSAWADTKNAARCIHGIRTDQPCRQCYLLQYPA